MSDNFWSLVLPYIKWISVFVTGVFAIYGIYVERRTRAGNINQAGRRLLPWVVFLAVLGVASHFGESQLQRKEEAEKSKAHDELLAEIRSGVYSLHPNSGLRLRYSIELPLDDPALNAYRKRLLTEIASHSNALDTFQFNSKSSLRPGGSSTDGSNAAAMYNQLGLYGSFSQGLTDVPSGGIYPPPGNVSFFAPISMGHVVFEFQKDSRLLHVSIQDVSLPGLPAWQSDGKVGSLVGLQRCLFYCRIEYRPSDPFDEAGGRILNGLRLSDVSFDLGGVRLDCQQLKLVTNPIDRAYYQTLSSSVRSVNY